MDSRFPLRPGRLHPRERRRVVGLMLAGALVLAPALVAPRLLAAQGIIPGEIIIEPTALRPQVLMTEPDRQVYIVNRSGRPVHVDFMSRDPQVHHVFQVPDRIWAVFHTTGRHPYEVHFAEPGMAELRGAIEVVGDPYGGPDPRVCSGVTVMGACIER